MLFPILSQPVADADPALRDLSPQSAPPVSRVATLDSATSDEIVLRPRAGAALARLVAMTGGRVTRASLVKGAWVIQCRPGTGTNVVERLRARTDVDLVFVNRRRGDVRPRAFVPNDPYYQSSTPYQFWLKNKTNPGEDIVIENVWNADVTGQGVRIGIVDDAVETAHPDLAPNYEATYSVNLPNGSPDPNPRSNADSHGTFVAGAAAARGGNGIGIVGAAPFAKIVAMRLPMGSKEATDEVYVAGIERSTLVNDARGPVFLKNHSYGPTYPFVPSPGEVGALNRTASVGAIHIWAAGNERGTRNQDVNKGVANAHWSSINVGAVNIQGTFAKYSNFGASLTCVVPAGDFDGELDGQVSTDLTTLARGYSKDPDVRMPGDATGNWASSQGTSFAAPTVAGVAALATQVRPAMTGRWFKHLLALTCRKNDPNDRTAAGRWITNAAGINFNPNYGFGTVDANALILKARATSGVSALSVVRSDVFGAGRIPDAATRTMTTTLDTGNDPIETVSVKVKIAHGNRGQLDAYLTSPSGTRTRLWLVSSGDREANIDWEFSANAFWGESSEGEWTLEVRDTVRGVVGRVESARISAYCGSLLEAGA